MIVYNLLLYLLIPIILLRLLWRGFKAPQYWQRINERFGFFSPSKTLLAAHQNNKKIIWLHTVSVGELLASKPLITACLARYPECYMVVTTTTPTGSEQAKKLVGDRIFHVYVPYDLPGSVKRFLHCVKPSLLLVMETEIWPTTISLCYKKNIPVVLMNARLSNRSLKRYQCFASFSSSIFKKIAMIVAQSEADLKNFEHLTTSNIIQAGSIKSDIAIDENILNAAKSFKEYFLCGNERPVLIAASTHKSEDEIILSAFSLLKKKYPTLLLMLAPRHPERFVNVFNLCQERKFSTIKKSEKRVLSQEDILIIDSIGELFMLYGVSDIAIMGGTFVSRGGHNFLEPAVWGKAIICGYSDYNFSTIAKVLESKGVLLRAKNAVEIAENVDVLLSNPELRMQKKQAAKKYIEENRGAVEKHLSIIDQYICYRET